jgi:tetratricopeptide (TPR) repeat protein
MGTIATKAVTFPTRLRRIVLGVLAAAACLTTPLAANAAPNSDPLNEMSVERWALLREVERFQLNLAEKFYRDKNYKVAADEYDKYIKLYERSEGAAFAQLKWSHCQVHQRKHHTAIKEGYQTLLDYFPESPEAAIASLLIGRTNKDMGDLKAAKKAYAKTIELYPKHFVAAMSRLDLVDIATTEKDIPRRAQLLRELTFDTERKGVTAKECVHASRMYAVHCFNGGDFEEGVKALATSCTDDQLPDQILDSQHGRLGQSISNLTGSKDEALKVKGNKLADSAVTWYKTRIAEYGKDPAKKSLTTLCWYSVADIYGSARQPDKARETFEQMLTVFGSSDALLGKIALWYRENKQLDRARETYAKYADVVAGQSHTADTFLDEGKFDRAIEVYRLLSVKDDKNAAKWMAAIASVYRRQNKADQAVAIYRELLTTAPGQAATWQWDIAETLFHAGKYKEAITTYRSCDRFPQNYDRMATAHRKMSQWDEAISLYRQIIAASPSHAPGAMVDIAETQEQASKVEDAKRTYKQVCDLYPTTQQASKSAAHLYQKYKITVTKGGAKQ